MPYKVGEIVAIPIKATYRHGNPHNYSRNTHCLDVFWQVKEAHLEGYSKNHLVPSDYCCIRCYPVGQEISLDGLYGWWFNIEDVMPAKEYLIALANG